MADNNNGGSGSDLDIKIGISVDKDGAKNELKSLINELENSSKIKIGTNMKNTSSTTKQATEEVKKQNVAVLNLGRGYKQVSDAMKKMYADSKKGTTVDIDTVGDPRKLEAFVATVKQKSGEMQKFYYTYNEVMKGFELDKNKTKSSNPTNALAQKQRDEINALKKEFDNKFNKLPNQYGGEVLNSSKIVKETEQIKTALKSLNSLNYGEFKQKVGEIRNQFEALKISASKISSDINTKNNNQAAKEKAASDEIKRLQKIENFTKASQIRLQNLARSSGETFNSPAIKTGLANIETRLKNLNKVSLDKLGNEFKEIELAIRQVGANSKDMQSSMSWIQKVSQNTSKFFEWYVSANMVMQAKQFFTSSASAIMEMNEAMVELNKVTDMSDESLNSMKESAMSLSKELGRNSTEIMASMAEFGRITKDKEEILQLARVAGLAANVTSLSADEAASALNTTILSMNLNISDAMTILNQFNAIQNNYRTSAEDLSESIGAVGAIANQAGISLDELNGYTTALVSSTGISGAEAGNAIKSFISRAFRIGEEGVTNKFINRKLLTAPHIYKKYGECFI